MIQTVNANHSKQDSENPGRCPAPPTIFVIFIKDITNNLSRHIYRALNADDFTVWNASERTQTATIRIQEALNNTFRWVSLSTA